MQYVIGGVIDVYPSPRYERKVPFNAEKINEILGTEIPKADMEKTLISLGFKVEDDTVIVPTHRYDIAKDEVTQYNDLSEEIARMYGYNKLPSTIMKGTATARLTERQLFTKNVIKYLLGLGFYEIETFSFYSPKNFDLLNIPADRTIETLQAELQAQAMAAQAQMQ